MHFTNSKGIYLFVCVIIIFQSKKLFGSAVLKTDFKLYDIDVKINKFSQVISAKSKITCCNRCARTTGCASVSFNADEKLCLLSEEETLDVSATNDWKTYIDTADDCIPEPCLNGATCTDALGTFTCTCAVGWEGQLCESDISECSGSPCLNGAVCTELLGSYYCACAAGYYGTNCETSLYCDPEWYYFDYSCYLFVDYKQKWSNSKFNCINEGGHLIDITSVAEQEVPNYLYLLYHPDDLHYSAVWTGAHGFGTSGPGGDGIMKWSTQTEIANGYTNWDIDQPDNGNGLFPGGEDCGNLRPWSDFKWNDERCNFEHVSICEKEVPIIILG